MGDESGRSLIVAGDIGGTKCNLALFRITGDRVAPRLELHSIKRFKSAEYPGVNSMLREFFGAQREEVAAACLGVPGPVAHGKAKATNLAWGVDASSIAAEFGIPHVSLMNDLAANAYAIASLPPEDIETIQAGDPEAVGNRCVVSPGTGLGEAGLFWDGQRHHVWACEGGHTDFAPRSELEMALLNYLTTQYVHVSVERVVSGIGIVNIYKFLRDTGHDPESADVAEEMKHGDAAAVIQKHADARSCPICMKTMDLFVNCFGAEAGNMALKAMALGGIYLGGGISVKMLPALRSDAFLHAFRDKGRLQGLLEMMPIRVILNDEAAVLGAARYALDAVVAR